MLRTERLLLRDFRADDFEAVHAYATDLEVVRYMTWGPNSEADTRDFLKRAQSHAEVEPRVGFELAVVREETDDLIGGVGLHVDGCDGDPDIARKLDLGRFLGAAVPAEA